MIGRSKRRNAVRCAEALFSRCLLREAAPGNQRAILRERHKATNSIIPQSSALPNAMAEYDKLLRGNKRTTAPFCCRRTRVHRMDALRGAKTVAAEYDAKIARPTLRGRGQNGDDVKQEGADRWQYATNSYGVDKRGSLLSLH
jgi:hypothetical protein